jgi:hypothetical protein
LFRFVFDINYIVTPRVICANKLHVSNIIQCILSDTGEGVILRKSNSIYENGRSTNLLKIKVCLLSSSPSPLSPLSLSLSVSHLISPHLNTSHLISSRLVSSRLVSSRLVSSRLVSSHLISSHLISYHFNIFVFILSFRQCVVIQKHSLLDCTTDFAN